MPENEVLLIRVVQIMMRSPLLPGPPDLGNKERISQGCALRKAFDRPTYMKE